MPSRVALGAMVAIVVLAGASSLFAASCQGLPDGATCDEIPSGGCPTDRGGSCDDPSCRAIYDCNNGIWAIATECPLQEGGAGGGSPAGTDGGVTPLCSTHPEPGDGGCATVTLDLSGSIDAASCTPDLMDGDCPYEAAQGCAACVCLEGCLDFYICTQPGWVAVAYCTDDGTLIASRQ